MFNFQGSELIIILLLALVVLGPEKLPEAMRRAGRMYADLKKMSTSFQDEFRSVIDEPMREMRDTASMLRDSADFTKLSEGDRVEKPKSAEMGDAPTSDTASETSPEATADADGDPPIPSPDLPFTPSPPDEPTDAADGFGTLPTPRRDVTAADAAGDRDEATG